MEQIIQHPEISKEDYNNYILQGIDYHQYKIQMEKDFQMNTDEQVKEYIKLNTSRMHRVEKMYGLSKEMEQTLHSLKHKIY